MIQNNKEKKNEESLRNLWDTTQWTMCTLQKYKKNEKREDRSESLTEEIMTPSEERMKSKYKKFNKLQLG
jgi:hypothetical protein